MCAILRRKHIEKEVQLRLHATAQQQTLPAPASQSDASGHSTSSSQQHSGMSDSAPPTTAAAAAAAAAPSSDRTPAAATATAETIRLERMVAAVARRAPRASLANLGLEEALKLGLGGPVRSADFVTGLLSLNR